MNTADGKLFFKDSAGVVQTMASKATGAIGGSTTQIQFNNAGALGGSASLTWNGTVLTSSGFSGPLNGTVGATTPAAGSFTTTTIGTSETLSYGTANGVAYLNGSKVLTSGSALVFDGTNLSVGTTALSSGKFSTIADLTLVNGLVIRDSATTYANNDNYLLLQNSTGATAGGLTHPASGSLGVWGNDDIRFFQSGAATELMRLTSTGLGIGTSSPAYKLDVSRGASDGFTARIGRATGTAFYMYSDTTNSYLTTDTSLNNSISLSATGNYIAFTTNNGTERARIDSSGNVGIGTSSPIATQSGLDISSGGLSLIIGADNGSSTRTNAGNKSGRFAMAHYTNAEKPFAIALCDVTSTTNELSIGGGSGACNTATVVKFFTAANNTTVSGSERARIDSSGNLGLGVTPSAWQSYLAFQMNAGSILSYSTNDYRMVQNTLRSAGAWKYINNGYANAYVQDGSSGGHVWYTAPSGTAGNAITFTQAMTLDASGNLLVGTTSSQTKLTVGGFASSVNSQWNGVAITTPASFTGVTGNIGFYLYASNGGGSLNAFFRTKAGSGGTYDGAEIATDNRPFRILTSTTEDTSERLRVDTSGNLLVGTTDNNGTNTQGLGVYIGGGGTRLYIGHANGTANGTQYVVFNYNGTSQIGSITQSGTTAVLYNVTSDQRLKENIVDAPEFGSVIDAIQVRSYDWITDKTHQRAGFVAQELVTVAPEAVHQPADPEAMMAVDYSKLVPMLVKEIQDLRKRLAAAGI
jgi:hypothetical protein